MKLKLLTSVAIAVALAIVLGMTPAQLPAQHNNAGSFENAGITLTGTVMELLAVDPHSLLVFDVKGENGETVRWQAKIAGQRMLNRCFGWNNETLQPGDRVTVMGRQIKSGAPYISLTNGPAMIATDSGKVLLQTNGAERSAGSMPAGYAASGCPAGGREASRQSSLMR